MRNLAIYPLTDEEVIEFCQRKLDEIPTGIDAPIGSMTGLIYQEIIDRFKQYPK